MPDLNPSKPLPIIVRATNGKGKKEKAKKLKLSTVVQPGDLEGFFAKYQDVCKAGMSRLKPRDRSKKKGKAKKRKGGTGSGAATS
jgi:signal recognition particle subunit SRP14